MTGYEIFVYLVLPSLVTAGGAAFAYTAASQTPPRRRSAPQDFARYNPARATRTYRAATAAGSSTSKPTESTYR